MQNNSKQVFNITLFNYQGVVKHSLSSKLTFEEHFVRHFLKHNTAIKRLVNYKQTE